MSEKLFIGVDPGKSGSIAFVPTHGEPWTIKNSETEADLSSAMADALDYCSYQCFAALEKVHSSPQMGVKSAFAFGDSFGSLRMLLTAMDVPFELVRPQQWQRSLGCLTKGDKNVSKARAQQLFPTIKVTHANADALLLAVYAWRVKSLF